MVKMRYFRRHLFSILVASLIPVVIFGWWYSTRVWSAINIESPVGIAKLRSESSLCGGVVVFTKHDHRWAMVSSPDTVTGDRMKFVMSMPKFELGSNGGMVLLPYWQLIVFLMVIAAGLFYLEHRRRKRFDT